MHKMLSSLARSAIATSLALAFSVHAAPAAKLPIVKEAPLRGHLAFLSSDLLEGRGTGQRGGDLTVAYLEAQAMSAGLKPANGNSFRQAVKIAGVKAAPESSNVGIEAGGKALPLAFGKDWVWGPGDAKPARTMDAEMVFVGYGISAPEEGWDDFKGLDAKGKVLVMMVNDPMPTAAEPNRFNGKGLTYYGRWTYKLEQAARLGAAGVLMIHTDASASYGWSVVQNSWMAEQFQLAEGKIGAGMQGWMTDATARTLFAASGFDLDQLRAAAEDKGFKPVVLNTRVKGEMKSTIRSIEQFNVAGVVPGTDPKLKDEVVIYTGHWDHLGKQGTGADNIYNGAVDNASGIAGLLAMAQEAVKAPAKRSQMFLFVARGRTGLAGQRRVCGEPAVAAGQDGRQPEPGQPQFRGRHQGYRHLGQRPHGTGHDGGGDRESHGHGHQPGGARPGRRLFPQRPFQFRQGRRAGVLGQGRQGLRQGSGRRQGQERHLSRQVPPGGRRVRSELGLVGHGAASPVHPEPGPHDCRRAEDAGMEGRRCLRQGARRQVIAAHDRKCRPASRPAAFFLRVDYAF